MRLDFKNLNPLQRYKIMSHTVVPRPIAWIVTEYKDTINIAPFSYFIPLSSEPPTLIVSIGHKKNGEPKDTLKNILKTKKCTICFVSQEMLKDMHYTSKDLPYGTSEAEYFNIDTKRVFEEFPPMIKSSPSAFFCTLNQVVDLKGSKTVPLILEVEKYLVDDKFVRDKEKLHIELDLIARVGKEYSICKDKITPPVIP